jgi:hypothetical protein
MWPVFHKAKPECAKFWEYDSNWSTGFGGLGLRSATQLFVTKSSSNNCAARNNATCFSAIEKRGLPPAVALRSLPPQMEESALAERRRANVTNPRLIAGFVECPAFLYGFQTALKQQQAGLRSRNGVPFALSASNALRSRICSQSRLLLITGGRLSVIIARKLLRFTSECAVRYEHRLRASVLSPPLLPQLVFDLCGDSGGAQQDC